MDQNGITDIVIPRQVWTWNDFCANTPHYSIALDGIVYGKTRFDPNTSHANFNHHEEVDRFSTHATCGILQTYIKTGLFKHFWQDGHPKATLYFNDPDQDSSLSRWMLHNHERVLKGEPLLHRLIYAEDMLDMTGGIFPFGLESHLMSQIAWIFDPYTASIHQMKHMQAKQMLTIMDAIGDRIDSYLIGKGGSIVPDDRFEVIHDCGDHFKMVQEIGPYARTKLFSQGTNVMISYRGEGPKGRHHYSFAKLSPFSSCDPEYVFQKLNAIEGIIPDCMDRWGGGNVYGGSPRNSGSSLNPDQLSDHLTNLLKKQK